MATTVDTLETVYKLTDRYSGPVRHLTALTTRFGLAVSGVTALLSGLGVTNLVKTATSFDSLNRALVTILGSTEAANAEFARLQQLAKLPGLGLEQAAEGLAQLVSAGLSVPLAERALLGFSNALASVGKGKTEFDFVLRALTQIASKSKLSAEEVNQLAEHLPQIRPLLVQAFGTSDTEAIQRMGMQPIETVTRIIHALETLPRATTGAQAAFDNLSDSFRIFQNEIGKGLLPTVTRIVEKLGQLMDFFAESGLAAQWGRALSGVLDSLVGGIDSLESNVFALIALLENLPAVWGRITKNIGAFFYNIWASFVNFIYAGLRSIEDGLNRAVDGFNDFFERLTTLEVFGQKIAGMRPIESRVDLGVPKDLVPREFQSLAVPQIDERAAQLAAQFEAFKAQNRTFQPLIDAFEGGPLQAIEKHTRQIAQNTDKDDLRRFALGGGPLGEMGITPIEFFRGTGRTKSRGANGAVTVRFDRRDALSTAIEGVVNDVIEQLARTGQWPGLGMAR